jgi:hypothetical protein
VGNAHADGDAQLKVTGIMGHWLPIALLSNLFMLGTRRDWVSLVNPLLSPNKRPNSGAAKQKRKKNRDGNNGSDEQTTTSVQYLSPSNCTLDKPLAGSTIECYQ